MAAKWGKFNWQISNSKMTAKIEDGGRKIGLSQLKL